MTEPPLQLTKGQRKQLFDALLSAYPNIPALKQMLSLHLDKNLEEIGGTGLREVVFNLITDAETNGYVQELILHVCEDKPNNPKLRALATQLHLSITSSDTTIQALPSGKRKFFGYRLAALVCLCAGFGIAYLMFFGNRSTVVVDDVIVTSHDGPLPSAELDFRVRNEGKKVVTINRVRFRTLYASWEHPPAGAYIKATATYGLDISKLKEGKVTDLPVSHVLQPSEADRFLVRLTTSPEFVNAFHSFDVTLEPTLVTSNGNVTVKEIKAGAIYDSENQDSEEVSKDTKSPSQESRSQIDRQEKKQPIPAEIHKDTRSPSQESTSGVSVQEKKRPEPADVVIDDIIMRPGERIKTMVLDFRIRNQGGKSASINHVRIKTVLHAEGRNELPNGFHPAPLSITSQYSPGQKGKVGFVVADVGKEIDIPIAQALKPDEVDRFTVIIAFIGEGIYKIKPILVTSSGNIVGKTIIMNVMHTEIIPEMLE